MWRKSDDDTIRYDTTNERVRGFKADDCWVNTSHASQPLRRWLGVTLMKLQVEELIKVYQDQVASSKRSTRTVISLEPATTNWTDEYAPL